MLIVLNGYLNNGIKNLFGKIEKKSWKHWQLTWLNDEDKNVRVNFYKVIDDWQ